MSNNIKYIYGVCQNIDYKDGKKCPLCETNEKQKKRFDEDFVCSECGEPLRRVAAPKNFGQKYGRLLGAVCAIILIGGIVYGVITVIKNRPELPEEALIDESPADSLLEDTADSVAIPIVKETKVEPKVEPAKPSAKPASTKKDLGYAIWKGRTKNGLPDDENGTMTYKTQHLIDNRDPQGRVAEPGDYIIGEFSEGKLVQGIWYDCTNTVKGSIIIGK